MIDNKNATRILRTLPAILHRVPVRLRRARPRAHPRITPSRRDCESLMWRRVKIAVERLATLGVQLSRRPDVRNGKRQRRRPQNKLLPPQKIIHYRSPHRNPVLAEQSVPVLAECRRCNEHSRSAARRERLVEALRKPRGAAMAVAFT